MTAQEYLEEIRFQDKKVRMMRIKLKMLREALDIRGVSYVSDGSKPSNHPTDNMAAAICKVIDYENEVKEEEAVLAILRFEAEKAIQALSDENEREVLERIYLLFQSVEMIKKEISYSVRRIYEFRKSGLEKIVVPENVRTVSH